MKSAYNNKKLIASYRAIVLAFIAFFTLQCTNTNQQDKKSSQKTDKHTEFSKSSGIWFPHNPNKEKTLSTNQTTKNELNKLKTLGYLSGYQAAPERSGVTKYDPSATFDGINLFVSGHKPHAALINMKGVTLHEWAFDFAKSGLSQEGLIVNRQVDENYKNYWRRVFLYENGDILAIYDYLGIVKLDSQSNLKWVYPGRAHHDMFVSDNGDIWTLTAEKKILPIINQDIPVLEEFICRLNSEGKEIEKISLLKCFENSSFTSFLHNLRPNDKDAAALDVFHTNSLQLLDGTLEKRNVAFKRGNILVSIRQLNLLAIIDPKAQSVIWVREGTWKAQHEARLLDNGHILLFDNIGKGNFSRVLEIDPLTNNTTWSYQSTPPTNFFSPIVGAQQRLPNGNTLVTDTAGGKAFEVTFSGETVWEFVNPNRSGENNNLIAALFEVIRYESSSLKVNLWKKNAL